MSWAWIEYEYPQAHYFHKELFWANKTCKVYFALKLTDTDAWTYYGGNVSHALDAGKKLTSYGNTESSAQTNYLSAVLGKNLAILPALFQAKYARIYIETGSNVQLYEWRPSTYFSAHEIISGEITITDELSDAPLIKVTKSSVDRIVIGNFTGSTYGIAGYNASGTKIFELSDAAQTIGGWSFGATTLSSGSLIFDSATPAIKMGSATGYMTGIGVFLGNDGGTYKFHFGNPSSKYIKWDGTDLTITGAIISGGSDIGSTISNSFTINSDLDNVNVDLVLGRTTGGNATMRWNGTVVSLDKTLSIDHINEYTSAHGVTLDSWTLKDGGAGVITGGTNTFNITNGTAVFDVAAGATLDVNANLTVESASYINQDVTSDGSPTFNQGNFTTVHTTTLLADHIGEHTASHNITMDNGVLITNGLGDTTGADRILFPGGGSYNNDTASVYGAIEITLPLSLAEAAMLHMRVVIYDYRASSTTLSTVLDLYGYTYATTPVWYNVYAVQTGHRQNDLNIRWGRDASSWKIWIGELDTVWQYPKVCITEVTAGFSYGTFAKLGTGWSIAMEASAFDTVDSGPTAIPGAWQNLFKTSSPIFATVKCTDLTDGYVPYHSSDSVGLVDSPIRTNGTNIGLLGNAVSSLYSIYAYKTYTDLPDGAYQFLSTASLEYTGDCANSFIGGGFLTSVLVNTGYENTDTIYGGSTRILRNATAVGSNDGGTLSSLRGYAISFGHYNTNTGATPQTTSAHGLTIFPYYATGKITNMYQLNLAAPTTGGTAPDVFYSIYQPSTIPKNYLMGDTGFGVDYSNISARVHVVDTTEQLRLGYDTSNYASFTVGAGGNLTVAPTGDFVFDPTGNDILPATNYDLNIGLINKKYLTLHCAELWVETLVAQDTIATIGGRILVGPTTTLTSDLAPADTTIYVKHNEMASGDRVYMEADGKVEFMAITSAPGGSGPYSYSVTRNLDGSGANQWYAGDAVFNTGTTGEGFIDIYSLHGVKEATDYGPTITGNVRNSTTYNDWTECWALGNLNGLYGYGATTFGVAFGKYSVGNYMTIDVTNGVRFFDSSDVVRAQLTGTAWTLGYTTDEHVNITTTSVQIKGGATVYTDLTAGVLTLGDSANEHVTVNSSGVSLYDGATLYGQFAATTTLGVTTAEHIQITSSSIQFRDSTTVYTDLTAGVLTLGLSSAEHVTVDTNGVSLYDSSTLYGRFAATTTLGITTSEHIEITSTSVKFLDSTSIYTELTAGVLTLGLSTAEHAVVDTNGVSLYDSTSMYARFAATTTVGLTTDNHVSISSGHVQLKNSTTVYTDLAAGVLTLGSSSGGEYMIIDATDGIRMFGNATLYAQLTNAGVLTLGNTSAEYVKVSSSGTQIYDGTTLYATYGATTTLYDSAGADRLVLSSSGITLGDSTSGNYVQITDSAVNIYSTNTTHLPSDVYLKGYWKFDEGVGKYTVDNSGGRSPLTLSGSPSWCNGVSGSGITFNGSSQYAYAGTTDFDFTGLDLSISCWVKRGTTATLYQGIATASVGTGATRQWLFAMSPTTYYLGFWAYDGSTWAQIKSTTVAVPENVWTHVGIVFNNTANTVQLYIDGEPSGTTGSLTDLGYDPTYLYVGVTYNGSGYLNGSMDELRIYSAALTANEMKALYLFPAGNTPTTVGFVGVPLGWHSRLSSSALCIYNGSTLRAEYGESVTLYDSGGADRVVIDTTGIILGDYTEGYYLQATPTSIQIVSGGGDRLALTSTMITLGDYTDGEYITVDATNGIRMYGGGTLYTQLTNAGALTLGSSSGGEYISIDATNGIRLYGGATLNAQLSNAGVLTLGSSSGGEYISIQSTGIAMYGNAAQRVSISSDGSGWVGTSTDGMMWDTSGNLYVSGSATIGVVGGYDFASMRNMSKASVFTEDFEDSDSTDYWTVISGTGEISIQTTGGVVGGKYLRVGNNSGNDTTWLMFAGKIPYDPTKIYKITVRVRRTAGTGTFYAGWEGFLEDGTTYCNTAGSNAYTPQHYHCASGVNPGATWTTYTGYTSGTAATGVGAAGTLTNPSEMHENVRYIRPLIICNYAAGGTAGTTEVDSFIVEVLDNQCSDWCHSSDVTKIDGGDIYAGSSITIGSSGHLKCGQTAYNTGTGFWLGDSGGTYKLSIGHDDGNRMTWDGTNLGLTFVSGGSLTINDGSYDRVKIGYLSSSNYGIDILTSAGKRVFRVDTTNGAQAFWGIIQGRPYIVVDVNGTAGETCEYTTIASALAAVGSNGAILFLKAGTYTLAAGAATTIPNYSIDIIGENRDSVIINNAAGYNGFYINGSSKTYHFANFTMTSVNTSTRSSMIYIYSSTDAEQLAVADIENVKFNLTDNATAGSSTGDTGIKCENGHSIGTTARTHIYNCYFSNGAYAISAIHYAKILVEGCQLVGQQAAGIYADADSVVIRENKCKDQENIGIEFTPSLSSIRSKATITSNSIDSVTGTGISTNWYGILALPNLSSCNITDNIINYTSTNTSANIFGIYIQAASSYGSLIKGNYLYISSGSTGTVYGILTSDFYEGIVSENIIRIAHTNHTLYTYGIYCMAYNEHNIYANNLINLAYNNAKEIGIYLASGTAYNSGGGNVTKLCGTSISNSGTSNTVTATDY